jgi:hypothetical protein
VSPLENPQALPNGKELSFQIPREISSREGVCQCPSVDGWAESERKGRYPLRLAFHQPFKYLHQILGARFKSLRGLNME